MNPKLNTSSMKILKSFSSKLFTNSCFDTTKAIMFKNSKDKINAKNTKKKLALFIVN
jgi:hypothetical protein